MGDLSVADVDRWDAGQVRAVFHAARNVAESNALASQSMATLSAFQTWEGTASEEAKKAAAATRKDLDSHGQEALAVAMAADRAADGIEDVKRDLAALRSDAAAAGFTVDVTGDRIVTGGFQGTAAEMQQKSADLQKRLDAILGEASAVDEELANAIAMADGSSPIQSDPGNPAVAAGGLTPDEVAKDAAQQQNRRDAFRQVYGHDPVSANDWRMATALDTHTYGPRDLGAHAQVVAGRFPPQPGHGVVRTNMFIPADKVQNTGKDWKDLTDGRWAPENFGDNRGPSAIADMEGSRVTVMVDYDHGVVVVRQNPTVAVDGQRGGAAAATPSVHVLQGGDGKLTIDYNAHDAYEMPLATAGNATVNGRITLEPDGASGVKMGGYSTIYPSMETYQYHSGAAPVQLQWDPANSGSKWGPATSLERHHWIGDSSVQALRPDMPTWKWELENLNPFGGDPMVANSTQLTAPSAGPLPSIAHGK